MGARKCLICLLVLSVVFTSVSHAALNAYLKIEGHSQGEIKGDVTVPGREDSILVIGFSHEVVSPREASSGMATDERHHEPVKITKRIDKATPLLMKALTDGEKMVIFRLDFVRLSQAGTEEQYYSIELVNAQIVGIRQNKLNTLNTDNDWSNDMETVWVIYDSINWIYDDSVTEAPITSNTNWSFTPGEMPRISDMNYDGTTNMLDLAILAREWLAE